jgi:hypothetical protein
MDTDFTVVATTAAATMIATPVGVILAAVTTAVLATDVDTITARGMVTGRGMATAAVREDLQEAATGEAMATVDITAEVAAADFMEAARVAAGDPTDTAGTTKALSIVGKFCF